MARAGNGKAQITVSPEDRRPPASDYPWDTEAPIRVRLLRVREELRSTPLWKKFTLQREFEAFSIHELAFGVEPVLAKHGVAFAFSVEKWSKAGSFALVEGWGIFTAVDQDGEEFRVYTIGEGMDNGDKGFGKAISYARKNGLVQGLNLGIGIDNEASDEKAAEPAPPQQGQAPEQPRAPEAPPQASAPTMWVINYHGASINMATEAVPGNVQSYLSTMTAEQVETFVAANRETFKRIAIASRPTGEAIYRHIVARKDAQLAGAATQAAA